MVGKVINKIKTKKCKAKGCNNEFQNFNSMIKHCSPQCAMELHKQNVTKKEKAKAKAERKKVTDYREANKTIGQWKKEAQAAVNSYIRIKYHTEGCISCDKHPDPRFGGSFDAGHYRSVGSAGHMRFNIKNIFKQCKQCNRDLSGNHVEFRKRLVSRFGEQYVLDIEYDQTIRKFDPTYCKRIKRIFNKKTRIQKKRLGID